MDEEKSYYIGTSPLYGAWSEERQGWTGTEHGEVYFDANPLGVLITIRSMKEHGMGFEVKMIGENYNPMPVTEPINEDDYGDDMTSEEITAYLAVIENPWIPVSHSLPQKDTPVLIRVKHHDAVLYAVASIPHGSVCWLLEFPFGNPPGWQYLTDSVITWMPIPALVLPTVDATTPVETDMVIDATEDAFDLKTGTFIPCTRR